MSSFNKIKTEAFILKKIILLEKDILIFFFSQEKGKIIALAKGARKITSKRISYLETGNLVNIILEKRKEKLYLKEIDLISGFYKIKADFKKINALYSFFYVLDKILPENQKEEKIYTLTKQFFININNFNKTDDLKFTTYKYINKVLISLGYLKEEVDKNQIKKILFELTNEKIPSFII